MFQTVLALSVLVSTVVTIVLLCLPSRYQASAGEATPSSKSSSSLNGRRADQIEVTVQVVVLGDIGRSPRMQYHALSIAKHGGHVQVIGYQDSHPHPDLIANPRVSLVPLPSPPRSWQTSNKLLFLLLAPLKVAFQICTLWFALGYRTKPAKWMLVQNPPSIPTLVMAWLICFLRSTKLVIDWHNFGYSILALKLGPSHPLVKASRWYEMALCRGATAHFTVTNAMARVLEVESHSNAPIWPLHDRPAFSFKAITMTQRSAFLSRLADTKSRSDSILRGNTRLVVSSTSWTSDEDFSLLLEALCMYSEKALTTHPQLPEILAIITGKGPLKETYLRQIETLKREGKLEMTTVQTAWLSIEDYALLLASADLGVSLHTSSSGVDLPMKVVDMFGAGLPVTGWSRYEAWPELVTEGVNGKGFGSADELVDNLVELFCEEGGKDDGGLLLQRLKNGALAESRRRWDDEWDPIAGKLFFDLATKNK